MISWSIVAEPTCLACSLHVHSFTLSIPRSSITFTAMRLCGPGSKGSEMVPRYFSISSESISAFRFRASRASLRHHRPSERRPGEGTSCGHRNRYRGATWQSSKYHRIRLYPCGCCNNRTPILGLRFTFAFAFCNFSQFDIGPAHEPEALVRGPLLFKIFHQQVRIHLSR